MLHNETPGENPPLIQTLRFASLLMFVECSFIHTNHQIQPAKSHWSPKESKVIRPIYICIYVCTPEVGVFQAKILKIPIEMANFVHDIHDLETEIRTPQACRRRYIYIGRITLDSLGDQ